MRTLIWFRGKDLRLADHQALASAASSEELIPLFVLDPYFFEPARAESTPHRSAFLLQSIADLQRSLHALGSRLLLVHGRSAEVVPELARRWKVQRVVAQAWVAPLGRERDRRVRASLDVPFELFEGETLLPPGSLRTGEGTPYSVFTPFARAFARVSNIGPPLPPPQRLPALPREVEADPLAVTDLPSLADLGLSFNPALQPGGEREARQRLSCFLEQGAAKYHEQRDRMDLPGTSRLSADLKFGTLSIREVWTRAQEISGAAQPKFLSELVWREFAHSTLWDRPELMTEPFRPKFENFPWRSDDAAWSAWVEGRTGYPVVDASARQLLTEGFVHNRARMISASFLTKDLLIDYKRGEAHYMRYLTDADWANNNAGWQWSAGCGSDAQPYFRIFNPVTQGQKFDPDGAYVRHWVPKLGRLPTRYVHCPWEAPEATLAEAGVRLGIDYPLPIVEHAGARQRFLEVASQHFALNGHA